MRPGPVLAMILLVFIGIWLVLQPTLERGRRIDPDAHRFDITMGAREIAVEQRATADGSFEYHSKGWKGVDDGGWIRADRFEQLIAGEMTAWEARPRWERTLMGFFNISSWMTFGWVVLGLAGQACFFGRMFAQWIKSEKERQSVVPAIFWWLSFLGGVLLFTYFVWRRDIVGVMGQSTGIVIYARNLRLIQKQNQRLAELDAQAASDPPSEKHT